MRSLHRALDMFYGLNDVYKTLICYFFVTVTDVFRRPEQHK
jgi:hypothetical protein